MLVALRTRAVAYEAAGQPRSRHRDLRELEKRGRSRAEDAVVLGDNLRLAGRPQEAVAVLERTARENPRFAQPLLSLAAVRRAGAQRRGGRGAYAKVLELAPDHTEALRGLGDLALIQGDVDDAAKRYARILELDPADAAR